MLGRVQVARWISLTAVAFSAGCFPTPPPDWLVEYDRALGIEFEVVEAGPLSRPLEEDGGRVRTEVMPGDTVRFRPLVADPDGEVVDLDAAWYLCRTARCFALDDLESCDSIPFVQHPDPQLRADCALGRGPSVEVVVQGTEEPDFPAQLAYWLEEPYALREVSFIAGVPGALSTDECLARLAKAPQVEEPVWDCLQQTAEINVGPLWAMYDVAVQQGLEPPVMPTAETLTQEPALRVEPSFVVTVDGEEQEIEPTETVTTRPGSLVDVEISVPDEQVQDIWVSKPDGMGGQEYETTQERILGYWMATIELEDLTVDDDGLHARWRAQTAAAPGIIFVLLRENQTWESLWWFEVDADAG